MSGRRRRRPSLLAASINYRRDNSSARLCPGTVIQRLSSFFFFSSRGTRGYLRFGMQRLDGPGYGRPTSRSIIRSGAQRNNCFDDREWLTAHSPYAHTSLTVFILFHSAVKCEPRDSFSPNGRQNCIAFSAISIISSRKITENSRLRRCFEAKANRQGGAIREK